MKYIGIVLSALLCVAVMALPVAAATSTIDLNPEEMALVHSTQNGSPLEIGILPYTFPLAECPPEAPAFSGINVEMLKMITQVSGLEFEYVRIPIEDKTPYHLLQEKIVPLVAGTIKLDVFLKNPKLVLSDRLCDGSSACISKNTTDITNPITGKIGIMHGYQAGIQFSEEKFPSYERVLYPNNQAVLRAVRTGETDLAMISRYAGIYELQNPLNEDLIELTPYKTEQDSCVMGLNTPENQLAISIINKALAYIGADGYNYMQMNFSITHPYKPTTIEFIYKYRYLLSVLAVSVIGLSILATRLIFAQRAHKKLSMDPLTGAYSEAGFEFEATKLIAKASKQLFMTDFDVYHFSSYNELNGKAQGDELLRNIVRIVKSFLCEDDLICRSYADNFKVLSSKDSLENLIADIQKFVIRSNELSQSAITLNFGIYPLTDQEVTVPKMLDFAAIAKKNVKHTRDVFIGVFDENLLANQINDARMTASFYNAVENKEFVAYYQPKVDASTGEIVGAEALVRWIQKDGNIIPPLQFIELFERSGQIQQLDFYMLKEVCDFLSRRHSQGLTVFPIAVNFSRVHLYSDEFVHNVNQIVDSYGVSKSLIEIECTETTMTDNVELTRTILGELQHQGFTIAMDDFGSAYSSLNALCSMPLDVIKLDGGFLRATLSNERIRAKAIISSVISLAHNLSLKIVAEGVETNEQYTFLKSLGCDFIQGYYFSRPLDEKQFTEKLLQSTV